MPKRDDISSVLVIGSGPIVIGQAAEFDYSGTQACRVLREEGIRVILVNSNPATIMTDPDFADATYIEPITTAAIEAIIAKERPDAILPTLGGQTALNAAMALHEQGILTKYNVELIGAKFEAIRRGEDRQIFKDLAIECGAEVARSVVVNSVDDALAFIAESGYPVVIRPSFTMGGLGSGFAYDEPELRRMVSNGIHESPTGEVLLDPPNGRTKGTIDSLRMTIGAVARLPVGLAMGRDLEGSELDPKTFDLSYTRGWPSALTLKAGAYDLDVSPHAGLGMSNAGGSAEAGAMVRFGSNLDTEFVQRFASGLGIHAVDGARYGDQGRWYLFAAASGRAVGLNMTRDSQTGDLRRSGWSVDPSAAIIGDTQAGFGWRKGSLQASLGYLHREVKNEFGVRGAGMGGESMVAFSMSIHPRP